MHLRFRRVDNSQFKVAKSPFGVMEARRNPLNKKTINLAKQAVKLAKKIAEAKAEKMVKPEFVCEN